MASFTPSSCCKRTALLKMDTRWKQQTMIGDMPRFKFSASTDLTAHQREAKTSSFKGIN